MKMETVRVELRKLQILNDRINQTIDALTQLRQSVHSFQPYGLQHTNVGYGAQMTPFAAPFAMQPPSIGPQAWAGAPAFGVSPWLGQTGLSHTSAYAPSPAWANQAGAYNGGMGIDPWSAARFAQQGGIAGSSSVAF
jgi:hypothetical protein